MPQINHPDYDYTKLNNYRLIKEGGENFINAFLTRLSRESVEDFNTRRDMTYNPAMAMACIQEIANALTVKMGEVKRTTNLPSYNKRSKSNIDNRFNSITQFFNTQVILELLCMGKVGIYVDRADQEIRTKEDVIGNEPYIYTYKAENITSWAEDNFYNLKALQLLSKEDVYGSDGLVTHRRNVTRTFNLTSSGVLVTTERQNEATTRRELSLTRIPFVLLELSHSLLKDIDRCQIALLNLSSSDISFLREANITTYIENYDSNTDFTKYMTQINHDDEKQKEQVILGSTKGRRYPKGLDAPQYIAPPSEPLMANMEKQEAIKKEMRQMLSLSINNLRSNSSSIENREIDTKEKESGLNVIGNELLRADRQIVEIWADYEKMKAVYEFEYPTNWSVESDEKKISKSKDLIDLLPRIPSKTFQKEVAKKVNYTLLSDCSASTLETINDEIDNSDVLVNDPDVVASDIEQGLVGLVTASKLRGYPEGEVERAKVDHAERLKRIAEAQMPKVDPGARGIKDLSADPKAGSDEKTEAHDTTTMDTPHDTTRGEAD